MSFWRFVIIAKLWRPEVARIETKREIFFGKRTPCDKNFKILFRKFTSRHRSTLLCAKFVKSVRREIGEIVRYLGDQKNKQNFGSLSNCAYCADRAPSLPWPALNIWLTMFQMSCKSVHFRRPHEGRQNAPIFDEGIASR